MIFDCAELHFLERTPAVQGGEIWLADALRALLKHEVAYAYEFEGRRYDAGNALEYLKANVDPALQRPEYREQLLAHLRAVLAQADRAEPSVAGHGGGRQRCQRRMGPWPRE
jgi:UTP-glucose-1-phosphate uridylyltransferase